MNVGTLKQILSTLHDDWEINIKGDEIMLNTKSITPLIKEEKLVETPTKKQSVLVVPNNIKEVLKGKDTTTVANLCFGYLKTFANLWDDNVDHIEELRRQCNKAKPALNSILCGTCSLSMADALERDLITNNINLLKNLK